MFDFTLGNQRFDGAGDVLDRHVRIDAMLVQKVNRFDTQAPQRALDRTADVIGPAADATVLTGARVNVEAEFGGDDYAIAESSQRPFLLGAARPSRSVVRLGVTTYSYRDLLETPGEMIGKMIAANRTLGLKIVELWDASIQPPSYANGAAWQVLPNGQASAASIAGRPPEGPPTSAQIARAALIRKWRLETPLSHFAEIGRRFARAGIQVQAFASDLKDDFSDAEIDRTFQIARSVGAGILNTSTTVTMAQRTAPFTARHKMRLALHNHSNLRDPNQIATPESFERCLAMSSWYRINLDIGHFSAAGFDPVKFLRRYHGRTTSNHLKDRKNDDGPNVPFGEGGTPLREIIRLVRDRGWKIALIIEYEYAGGPSIEALRVCRDYAYAALV